MMPDKSVKFCACIMVYTLFQCEQLEGEMVGYLQLQRSHLHRAMDVLHTYATIISQVSGGCTLQRVRLITFIYSGDTLFTSQFISL